MQYIVIPPKPYTRLCGTMITEPAYTYDIDAYFPGKRSVCLIFTVRIKYLLPDCGSAPMDIDCYDHWLRAGIYRSCGWQQGARVEIDGDELPPTSMTLTGSLRPLFALLVRSVRVLVPAPGLP